MGTVQVMALNPARRGNMGRLNSSQPLTVYDTLIAQPWLKGVRNRYLALMLVMRRR